MKRGMIAHIHTSKSNLTSVAMLLLERNRSMVAKPTTQSIMIDAALDSQISEAAAVKLAEQLEKSGYEIVQKSPNPPVATMAAKKEPELKVQPAKK